MEGVEGEKRSGGRCRTLWRMRREDKGEGGTGVGRGERVRKWKEGTRLYNKDDDRTS